MSNLQSAIDFAHQNHDRFLKDLEELIAIPSISTSTEYNADVQRAAEFLAARL